MSASPTDCWQPPLVRKVPWRCRPQSRRALAQPLGEAVAWPGLAVLTSGRERGQTVAEFPGGGRRC